MLKDKELTSLHDSLFAKFKDYALSKEEMRQVRGGGWVQFQLANGSKTDVWERENGNGCEYGVKDQNGIMQCWTPPLGSRKLD